MKRIPRRLFTEEFKREAIKLVTEQHLNVAAKRLDSKFDSYILDTVGIK